VLLIEKPLINKQNSNHMDFLYELKKTGKTGKLPERYKDSLLLCLSAKIEKTKPNCFVFRISHIVCRVLKKQSKFIRGAYCVMRIAKRHFVKTKPISYMSK